MSVRRCFSKVDHVHQGYVLLSQHNLARDLSRALPPRARLFFIVKLFYTAVLQRVLRLAAVRS